ncbi:AAA domain-containing protein [Pseudomonas germanica]
MFPFGPSSFLFKYSEVSQLPNQNTTEGKPILITAEHDDNPVLIKFWPKNQNDNSNILEDIWLYEIRQLHRLKGYPGLGDYISKLLDSGKDEHGFYLVLNAEMRLPLSHFMSDRTLSYNKPWVKKLRDPKSRIRFWHNIIRITNAIQLLHSQGLLHRHLDEDSILTDPSQGGHDFQLTGFEWSVRVQTMSGAASITHMPATLNSGKIYSFLTDWMDFGRLIAKILKIEQNALDDLTYPIKDLVTESGLILDEILFIRGLIGTIKFHSNTPKEGINAETIVKKIEKIISAINSLITREPEQYRAIFHLNGKKAEIIRKHHKISVFNAIQLKFKELHEIIISESNIDECIKFVDEDLRDEPKLILLPASEGQEQELLLIGSRLTYVINKNREGQWDTEGNWNSGFCHSAYLEPPKRINSQTQSFSFQENTILCQSLTQYKQQNKVDTNSWENIILRLNQDDENLATDKSLIDGFSAYHLTEIAYAKTEIYPVDLYAFETNERDPSIRTVKLLSRPDSESEETSKALGLHPPATRLHELLTNEYADSASWILTSNTNLSDEDQEIVIDFQKTITQHDGVKIYEFTTTSLKPDYQQYYIISSAVQGTISQLNRRAGAIDALSNHAELVSMLSNPYIGNTNSQDQYNTHISFDSLDTSKQKVFNQIMNTLPLYLVQGPPGVGKTYLVTTLAQQVFSQEPDSRILLTAQSHSTIQHLHQEVTSALTKSQDTSHPPLIVSCIKTNTQDNEGDGDALSKVDTLAKDLLQALIKSTLFEKSGTASAKEKIISMSGDNARSGRYSLIAQLLKAANMVFATTNSRQVEDLIKARSQFDWSIMEETGKVTGIELLSPLLLSYRRLMIGDHKQLPPYAAEKMRQILQTPEQLHSALKIATDIYNNSVKGDYIKSRFTDDFVQDLSKEHLALLAKEALRLHLLFESLINEEESAKKKSIAYYGSDVKHKPIASMLSIQHRMHPDIATLVSNVFYENSLTTAEDVEQYYNKTPSSRPFNYINSPSLEETPAIIWIDVPDKQSNRQFKQGEEYPRWNNTLEREIILSLLTKLRIVEPRTKNPKLAILSPYARQVDKLSNEINRKVAQPNSLEHLLEFSKPDDHSSFCSTVDGFQGAEADLVIVSMVRNNHYSYAQSALGFLLDSRRMNVLLSRAKHQLVIVGSFQFLQNWSTKIKKEEVDKGIKNNQFIVNLVDILIQYEKTKKLKRIDYKEILLQSPTNNKKSVEQSKGNVK